MGREVVVGMGIEVVVVMGIKVVMGIEVVVVRGIKVVVVAGWPAMFTIPLSAQTCCLWCRRGTPGKHDMLSTFGNRKLGGTIIFKTIKGLSFLLLVMIGYNRIFQPGQWN